MALERLAAWAERFSPQISLVPNVLLLEIAGSLGLFGGVEPLCRAVSGGLATLGFRARLAVAPTPAAAWLLAQADRGEVIVDTEALADRLADLPITVLADEKVAATLAELGIDRLGPLFTWPRAELARRLGPALADTLDRLLGLRPDPRPIFVPPPSFAARLDLPWPV